MVEDPEFRQFLQMTCPGYNLPTRKTFTESLLNKKYTDIKNDVQEALRLAEYVSITTDSWTSINNENYVAITAHYLHESSEILESRSNLIESICFEERHTADNLSSLLRNKIAEWGIESKIVCIVSDNAANILAAVRQGEWKSIGCFAHSINLLVQKALQELEDFLTKVKSIVTFFKRSSSALARLKQTQKQMNIPELKLVQEVPTRWNSTLDMLERILTLKEAIISTLALDNPELNSITQEEWMMLPVLIDLLKPFRAITEEISAEKNVTVSKVLIFVYMTYLHINEYFNKADLPNKLKCVIQVFRDNFFKRFATVEDNEILTAATVLDPRFKKYGFKDDRKYNVTVQRLRKEIANLNTEQDITEKISITQNENSGKSISDSIWARFDNTVSNLIQEKNSTVIGILELDRYLSAPLISRTENPLSWWHERRHVYPNLFKLVKKYLCVPATSVPCERIFSKAGQVVTEKRSRLKPKNVEKILFLNVNL